jgi:murein DD-endopeptidase MepM/ murein hydrolase activator NlpD
LAAFFFILLFSLFKTPFSKEPDLFNNLTGQSSQSFITQGEERKEIPDPIVVQENSFLAISSPHNLSSKTLGVLTGQELTGEPENKIIHYIVEKGDTISGIAQKFNISIETILWANSLSKRSVLKPGQELIILPVSGIMHLVKRGETLSWIAKVYKADIEEIISFNNLNPDGKIFVGDLLIIPGAKKPTIPASPARFASLPNSYFICPIPSPCRITQGLHWYNAVDFSNGKCGEPVYAAAQGTIQRTGYQRILGRYVRILHSNGVVTLYGHLSKILVSPGQAVSQGEIIGYTGYSGHTIPAGPAGCHLHFDVRGGRNPFAR